MSSLDFLYIALGGGFLLLVIFSCVLLLQLTWILRDVNKITANASEASEKIKETILEPLKIISEFAGRFGFIKDIVDKIRSKYSQMSGSDSEDQSEDSHDGGFKVKKVRK